MIDLPDATNDLYALGMNVLRQPVVYKSPYPNLSEEVTKVYRCDLIDEFIQSIKSKGFTTEQAEVKLNEAVHFALTHPGSNLELVCLYIYFLEPTSKESLIARLKELATVVDVGLRNYAPEDPSDPTRRSAIEHLSHMHPIEHLIPEEALQPVTRSTPRVDYTFQRKPWWEKPRSLRSKHESKR